MKALHKTIYLLFAFLPALLLVSCEKEIEFKGEELAPKLVLYSVATPGEPLTCDISHSAFFLTTGRDEGRFLSGIDTVKGIVTVKVGNESYMMSPVESMGQTFTYICDYVPKSGDHIVIEAAFPGFDVVSAETTVPYPAPLEVVTVNSKSVAEDVYECELTLRFKADSSPGKCYNLTPYTIMFDMPYPMDFESDDIIFRERTSSFSSLFGSTVPNYFTDALVRGKEHTATILIKSIYSETLFVTLQTVTETLYYYAISRDKVLDGDDFMSESVTLYSNIEGGYGCFCAAASNTCEIMLKK
jgi:hypothetical protein